MFNIKFKYRDKYSNWKWREQQCTMSSVKECKKSTALVWTVIIKLFQLKKFKKFLKNGFTKPYLYVIM